MDSDRSTENVGFFRCHVSLPQDILPSMIPKIWVMETPIYMMGGNKSWFSSHAFVEHVGWMKGGLETAYMLFCCCGKRNDFLTAISF